VTDPLAAGRALTLSTGDPYYAAEYSSRLPFPVSAQVYAYVDSVDCSTDYGAVRESDENTNRSGPVVSSGDVAGEQAVSAPGRGESPPPPEELPRR